jgi:hypothetical protein
VGFKNGQWLTTEDRERAKDYSLLGKKRLSNLARKYGMMDDVLILGEYK